MTNLILWIKNAIVSLCNKIIAKLTAGEDVNSSGSVILHPQVVDVQASITTLPNPKVTEELLRDLMIHEIADELSRYLILTERTRIDGYIEHVGTLHICMHEEVHNDE